MRVSFVWGAALILGVPALAQAQSDNSDQSPIARFDQRMEGTVDRPASQTGPAFGRCWIFGHVENTAPLSISLLSTSSNEQFFAYAPTCDFSDESEFYRLSMGQSAQLYPLPTNAIAVIGWAPPETFAYSFELSAKTKGCVAKAGDTQLRRADLTYRTIGEHPVLIPHVLEGGKLEPMVEPAYTQARGQAWFLEPELRFEGARYKKYGLPRVLGPGDIEKVGEIEGVMVAKGQGSTMLDIIYVLEDQAGCIFQPYERKKNSREDN